MPTYLTPGVYFQAPDPRTVPLQQRTDVAGFVGLAERGLLHQPQRLTTWREFREIFGDFLPYAHLAYAVHAFFENGGRACWVVRVANRNAAVAAKLDIPDEKETGVAYQVEAIAPGTWGNSLAVSVQAARLAASQHVVFRGITLSERQLAVSSIAGFEVGSQVRLSQALGTSPLQAIGRVTEVDVVRGILGLDISLPTKGLEHNTSSSPPISIESLEFTLLVWQAQQVVERFENLAIAPSHTRYAIATVNANSRLIRLNQGNSITLPLLPWQGSLQGGANGLRTLNVFDYVGTPQGDKYGLAALAEVDEVSILAIPDLTVRPQPPEKPKPAPRRKVNPCALETPQLRTIKGKVVDATSGLSLPGVKVEVDDGLRSQNTQTDGEGRFTLANLLPGNVELVLSLEGYEQRIYSVTVLAGGRGVQDVREIPLTSVDLPLALDEDDIFYAQAAMVRQCEELGDRFALLDPPLKPNGQLPDLTGIQSWRARFDTSYAALYYPWLVVRDPLQPNAPQGRLMPPSGHVAGIYAATDLADGVFRSPANRVLAFVEDVGVGVDDALQGILNPKGINAIRAFPGRGIRVYGARTVSSNTAWQFVNVRRLFSWLEEMMYDGLQWAVFELNSEQLRFEVRLFLVTLLDGLWRRGALVGDTPDAAYQVRCDVVTTPPDAQAEGRIVAEVKVAPTVPYEFIVLRLGLTTDELQISEV